MSYFPYRKDKKYYHKDFHKIGFILAPTGAFGNHIRLLCSLSDKIPLNFFIDKPLVKIKHKIEFIKNNLYFTERTWHNWLPTEWQFREQLDIGKLAVSHDLNLLHKNFEFTDKFLGVYVEPELCYKAYLKFSSSLDATTKDFFMEYLNNWFLTCSELSSSNPKLKFLDCTRLFQETLDYDLYQNLISWFDIDDKYEHAKEIHKIWYNLHKKAEKEFVSDITKIYSESP